MYYLFQGYRSVIHQSYTIVKAILKKKNKAGGITIPISRYTTKAVVIKTVWYWHKSGHTDQQNLTESLEINPCLYGQLLYNKGGKNIQW